MLPSNPSREPSAQHLLVGNRSSMVPSVQPMSVVTDIAPQRGNYLASYLEIPFLYKWLIIGCSLSSILLGWIAIWVLPRSYESQAKLKVNLGRESVSADPSATTGQTVNLQKTQEEEIVSALEILGSRHVADIVATKLGPSAIINGILPKKGAQEDEQESFLSSLKKTGSDWLWNALWVAGIKDDISEHELAVMRLQSTLSINSTKKSVVLGIQASSRTPEMAQAIVQCVTETFMEEHIKASRVDGSFAFFEKQTATAEAELNELIANRSSFLQERKLVSIEAGRDLLQQTISGIERDLVVAAGELEEARSQIEDLDVKVTDTEDEVVATKLASSDATWSGMRQRVYELELQEQNLSAHFTESHPKLLQIREQLEGAREILTNLKSERVDESKTPNPVKIALYQELQRQETRVAGLNSMIEMKQTQKKELEKQVEKLLDDERELTKMDRDIKTMETKLLSMRDKLEEARVIEGLQSQKISNINVIQPATFVERASSPNKKILVAGFLFLGLFSGIALSFVREGLSPAMRTYEDVETSLGCPVISQVPLFSNSGTSQLNEHYTYSRICQGLISDILFSTSSNQQRGRSVGVLSVEPGAGASTLAANLAMTSGVDCRLKTVLVDADERNRSVSRMFWLNNAPGLFDLVNGTASHSECLQTVNGTPINIIAATGNSRESALAASGSKLSQVLQPYLSEFDLLVVDLPPACQPDQAVAMAQHLDCVLIVIESGKTSRESAKRLIKRLKDSNTNVVGCVLNKSRNHLPGWVRRIVTPKA